jgi:GT2 family glycosyltransferase
MSPARPREKGHPGVLPIPEASERPHAGLSCGIVIPAWNAWEATKTCLAALRDTLGPGDSVVVVDNGSRDATPDGLKAFPWARVVTLPENKGFAAGCNAGARVLDSEVIVFLNNDTVPVGPWLRELRRAFEDEQVGAAGPRSNAVSGVQRVMDATYDPLDRQALESFAKGWMARLEGIFVPTKRLVGFCLAVRKQAYEQAGGFDEGFGIGGFEDDDLCLSLRERGWKLVIAEGSFVHHEGHVTFDSNQTPWFEHQCRNQARFFAKHPLYFRSLSKAEQGKWFAQLVTMSPDLADPIAEVLHGQIGNDPGLLALGSVIGPRLSVARALVWSHRLRLAGEQTSCPLRSIAEDQARPTVERLQAAAVAMAMFGDSWFVRDFFELLLRARTEGSGGDIGDLEEIFQAGLARLSQQDRARLEEAVMTATRSLEPSARALALEMAGALGLVHGHCRAPA